MNGFSFRVETMWQQIRLRVSSLFPEEQSSAEDQL